MNRNFLALSFLVFFSSSLFAQVGVNTDNSQPDGSAMLDVKSANKGMLIPRVALTGTNDAATIPNPATSLLVFNTATIGSGNNSVTPGYYFNSGTPASPAWIRLNTGGGGGGSGTGWLTGGNYGTASGSDFLGTTDNQGLDIRTNNAVHARFTTNGQIETYNTGQSVFLGEGAGQSDNHSSDNNYNVLIGYHAGFLSSTAKNNTAVGWQALSTNEVGSYNTAFGFDALFSNTDGIYNTATGMDAMYANQTGSQNTATGVDALSSNTSGSFNAAFGKNALYYNTEGNYNVAIGNDAGFSNSSGWSSIFIGTAAGYYNTIMGFNVFIGDSAGYHSVGGANTFCGSYAGMNTTTGGGNNFFGYGAGMRNATGYGNTFIGNYAGIGNTSGNGNVIIGDHNSYLESLTGGNNNVLIGNSSSDGNADLANTIVIGTNATANSDNQVRLGDNNITSLFCMGAYNGVTANAANLYVGSDGQIMRSTSSGRYKTDIRDLAVNSHKIYDLRPVSYISKMDRKDHFGLVAEDVDKVLPELVEYAKSSDVIPGSCSDELVPDAVQYPLLSVLLLKEIQDQKKIIDDQQQKINELLKRIEKIEQIQALK
jgi:trimeric autotransporter adhesin